MRANPALKEPIFVGKPAPAGGHEILTAPDQSATKPTATIVTITLLSLLAGMLYLSERLQTIEERLRPSADSGIVYVPAYSHVYSEGGKPLLLEVTLSVRNTDAESNVTLTRADYYDTKGKLLRRYITKPRQLTPLQSDSFVVEKADYEGGSGANFIVEWSAEDPISKPVIEAAMIGVDPGYQISFVRNGIPLESRER